MLTLVPVMLILISSAVEADWEKFATTADGSVETFYDQSRVKYDKDLIYIWVRYRLNDSEKSTKSMEQQQKLNCTRRTYVRLEARTYRDIEWKNIKENIQPSFKEHQIRDGSTVDTLAQILCQ